MTNTDQPRTDEQVHRLITITHTHAEGTLVDGTARGSGR